MKSRSPNSSRTLVLIKDSYFSNLCTTSGFKGLRFERDPTSSAISRLVMVKQSIERLAGRAVIALPQIEEIKNHLGQTVSDWCSITEISQIGSLL